MIVARSRLRLASLALVLALGACASAPPAPAASTRAAEPVVHGDGHGQGHAAQGHGHGHGHAPPAASGDPIERALDEVAALHGAPGPWAVAGYRMSTYALAKLGLARGSFDLEIVHRTPREVKYSCIADGAAAHSGASLGKLNLSLVDASRDDVLTIYRDKKSGKDIALRPTASFQKRYAETPREAARALGREVLELPPEQVFEEVPAH